MEKCGDCGEEECVCYLDDDEDIFEDEEFLDDIEEAVEEDEEYEDDEDF